MQCRKCKADIPEDSAYCNKCGAKQVLGEKRKTKKRPNGTGSVYKLQGYRRRPWVAAKSGTILGYFETKTEALEALGAMAGQKISAIYNFTFAQVYEEWRREHFPTIGKKGIEGYINSFSAFASLHNKKFRDLRTADFQGVIDGLSGKSRSTLSKHKQLITQMSAWAIRERIVPADLARFVRLPKEEKKEKEIFTDAEIARIEADGSEASRIVLMLIYTGMRIGELFNLPLSNYHGQYCIGGEKTEAGKNRVIPIRPEGRKHFAYFAEFAEGDTLLSGYAGNQNIKNFRRRDYAELLKRLNIPYKVPHCTRHTFASWGSRAGIKPEQLQKMLGHASYQTTADIYVHQDMMDLIRAVESASTKELETG